MKTIKAKIGISRAGMGTDTFMRMEIEDATSGVRFVELEIGMEDFAFFLTGLHGIAADCTLRGLEYVGKTLENKTENIDEPMDMPSKVDDDPEFFEDLLSSYEVDGWVATVSDLFNHHNRDFRDEGTLRKPYYKVSFHRYVETSNAQD